MNEITLIPCGTEAKFLNIEGTICSIEITFTNVVYKFGYFDREMNYKTVWCHEKELVVDNVQRQKVGFVTNSQV